MKKQLIISITCLAFFGCATTQSFLSSPQGQALLTDSTSLAKVAVQAAATNYGGPVAGQLAGAGLDALAAVLQGYVGKTIPQSVVKASPGITPVGSAVAPMVSNTKPVTQSDVNSVFQAATIATK